MITQKEDNILVKKNSEDTKINKNSPFPNFMPKILPDDEITD